MKELDKQMSISELANLINDRLKSVNKLKEFKLQEFYAKTESLNSILQANKLTDLHTISKALNWKSKLDIATEKFETLSSIMQKHDKLFENSISLQALSTLNKSHAQLNLLQNSLKSFTGQLTELAAHKNRWDIIQDFDTISNETVLLSNQIENNNNNNLCSDDLNEIKTFLKTIEAKIDQKDTDIFSIFLKIIAVIGFILALKSEYYILNSKTESVTKDDLEALKKELVQSLETKLNSRKIHKITSTHCLVKLKPKLKSYTIAKLTKGVDVVIVQISKKWAYISFINPSDNLQCTGWVMKKYLQEN
jgi:hypothetical protein